MKNSDKTSIFQLICSFAKIGVLTFGGGMAMLPMLEKECVEKNKWVTKEEMLDIFAIGQCTPGIIAVNTATYIGFKERKLLGALAATFGIIFPSFLIIILLATILKKFSSNVYVEKAFSGIRVAVCALITGSIIKLSKNALVDFEKIIIAVLAFCLQLFFGFSPIVIVISVIVWSAIIFFTKKEKKHD